MRPTHGARSSDPGSGGAFPATPTSTSVPQSSTSVVALEHWQLELGSRLSGSCVKALQAYQGLV